MASIETTTLRETRVEADSGPSGLGRSEGWKPSAIAADLATLGSGTLLAGLFNVALLFVVPRLISVQDYGYWRLFALYAGYVGFLHFGFPDGVLLRWAGRPIDDFHHEVRPAVKYLFWQHVILLGPVCAVAAFVLPGPLKFIGIAVAIYALIFNLVTLLQYSLQSAKVFRPVAISTVAAPALFLGFVVVWERKWHTDYREITSFYTAGFLVVLVFLLAWTKPWSGRRPGIDVRQFAKSSVRSGWPIVMASGGMMMIACADRLAVSWAATIQDFAQYSLAASAMAVPITVIQACSKVVFSHLAGVTPKGRKRIYGIFSRMLLTAWAVLLPYYFALDVFIRHFLPRYVSSLQYARILLLGIPFLAAIQILQMSYAYLNGIQRQFLTLTVTVLAVSLGATSFAAFYSGSLSLVAGVQVTLLSAWWLINEWTLRNLTGQMKRDWMKFAGIYLSIGTIYWLTTGGAQRLTVSVLTYYAALIILLVMFCREELHLWMRLLPQADAAHQANCEQGE